MEWQFCFCLGFKSHSFHGTRFVNVVARDFRQCKTKKKCIRLCDLIREHHLWRKSHHVALSINLKERKKHTFKWERSSCKCAGQIEFNSIKNLSADFDRRPLNSDFCKPVRVHNTHFVTWYHLNGHQTICTVKLAFRKHFANAIGRHFCMT